MSNPNKRIEQTLNARRLSTALEYENHQFIMLIQAMRGNVHPSIAAIGMRCVQEVVHIHYLVDERTDDVLEALEDIEFEWQALQVADITCERHLHVGDVTEWRNNHSIRTVYARYSG